jgi:hypothetical protein
MVFLACFAMTALAGSAPVIVLSEKPRAPCGVEPYPNYPARGASPEIAMWTASGADENWVPPTCTAWRVNSATLVVGLAGRFRNAPDADAMLARIGAISSLRTVRYWSVTDKRWNEMFTSASALEGPNPGKLRGDFSAAELRKSDSLFFRAADNRSGDNAVSRLRVSGLENGRIVVEIANVTPLHWFFLTFAVPGDLQTWYFLEHETDDWWRFYSFTRVLYASPFFVHLVPNASYINRASAMYRYFAGITTDRDPPAAP